MTTRSLRGAVWIGVMTFLAANCLAAQAWRGRADLEVRVSSRRGSNLAGARVELMYRDGRGDQGPAPVATDGRGRAVIQGLAAGTWQVEVTHPEYMSFVAVVRLDPREKPQITASFLEATAESSAPIQVKLLKSKGGPASPPLPVAETESPVARPEPVPTQPAQATAPEQRASPPAAEEPEPAPRPEPRPEPQIESTPATPAPKPTPMPEVAGRPTEPTAADAVDSSESTSTESAPVAPTPAVEPRAELPASDSMPEPETAPPLPEMPVADAVATQPMPGQSAEAPSPPSQLPEPSPPQELPEPQPAPAAVEAVPPPTVDPAAMPAEPEPLLDETPALVPADPVETASEDAPAMPSTEPAPAAPAPPTPAPEWRSYRQRTCPECRPGEWAVNVAVRLRGAAQCGEESVDSAAAAAAVVGGQGAIELAGYSGTVDRAVAVLDDEAGGVVAERLAAARAGNCEVLGITLPKGSRFVGFQYEHETGAGRTPCLPDEPCPGGGASFSGPPRITRGAAATVIHALASGDEGLALMTVFFRAPNDQWAPQP